MSAEAPDCAAIGLLNPTANARAVVPLTASEAVSQLRDHFGVRFDTELAEMIGVSANTIKVWKQRGAIGGPAVFKLACDFGLSLDWLVFGIGAPSLLRPTALTTGEHIHEVYPHARYRDFTGAANRKTKVA
jgi:antitoxin component HigA of HigAB toxin-antitoxin module